MSPGEHQPALADGRFALVRALGEGGTGRVYLADDRARGGQVALKSLRETQPEALLRLKNEFRVLADFAHPNVARLYELVAIERDWYVAMEYIDGVDFVRFVRGVGDGVVSPQTPMPAELVARAEKTVSTHVVGDGTSPTAVSVSASSAGQGAPSSSTGYPGATSIPRLRTAFAQLVEGVCALHAAGFVHRDLKPSNVYVDRSDRLVILDFGLVSAVGGVPVHDGEDRLVGTPAYIAPERISDPTNAAAPVDWYSVGVMLYEALTGRRLFRGEWADVRRAKLAIEPPPPSLLADVPADLDQLCIALLRRDPAERPTGEELLGLVSSWQSAGAGRPVVSVPADGELVGREQHLDRLRAAFEQVRRGEGGRAVLLRGRSGEGKTTLAEAFLAELERAPSVRVLRGRCYEMETVPYKAIDSLIDSLCALLLRKPTDAFGALSANRAAAVVQVFPVLARVDAIQARAAAGSVPADVAEVRRRAFGAVSWLLRRLAAEGPLVLFIDDLHWGDIDSAELLYRLVGPDRPALLFLATCRVEEGRPGQLVAGLVEHGEQSGVLESIRVGRLSMAQARGLAEELLLSAGADPSAAEPIARAAQGVPFVVHELVRYIASGAGATGAAIDVTRALAQRLARLDHDARQLLEVAAVSTRPVSRDFLRLVLGPQAAPAHLLSDLRSARLIRVLGQAATAELDIYHDIVRQAILAGLDPAARREYHRRLARALEARGEPDHDALVFHYLSAGEVALARGHVGRAAAAAEAAFAFDRAAELYQIALKHADHDVEERGALLRRLGDACANGGRGADAARAYLSAGKLVAELERVDLQRLAAMQYLISGHTDEGMALLRESIEAVGLGFPPRGAGVLVAFLGRRLQLRLRGLSYRDGDGAALRPLDRARLDACWTASVGLSTVDPITAAYFHTRFLLQALRLGLPDRIARGLVLEATHRSAPGGERALESAMQALTVADELADRLDDPHVHGLLAFNRGFICFLHGRWRQAVESFERALEILRDRCSGVAWELDTTNATMMYALYLLGDFAEITRRLPAVLRDAEARGDLNIRNHLATWIQPLVACMRDEPEHALAGLRSATDRLSTGEFKVEHLNALIGEIVVHNYVGDGAAAWRTVTARWPELKRSFLLQVEQIRVAMHAYRAAAALAATRGSPDAVEALRDAEWCVRRLRREQVAWARPCALALGANAAAIRGDLAKALDWLAESEREFEARDMRAFAAISRRMRGRLLADAEGAALVADADAYLSGQGVRVPARIAATFLTEPQRK